MRLRLPRRRDNLRLVSRRSRRHRLQRGRSPARRALSTPGTLPMPRKCVPARPRNLGCRPCRSQYHPAPDARRREPGSPLRKRRPRPQCRQACRRNPGPPRTRNRELLATLPPHIRSRCQRDSCWFQVGKCPARCPNRPAHPRPCSGLVARLSKGRRRSETRHSKPHGDRIARSRYSG